MVSRGVCAHSPEGAVAGRFGRTRATTAGTTIRTISTPRAISKAGPNFSLGTPPALPSTTEKKTVPTTATPTALPSWPVVLSSPDADPAWATGTSVIVNMPIGATISPKPAPDTTNPGTNAHVEVSAVAP